MGHLYAFDQTSNLMEVFLGQVVPVPTDDLLSKEYAKRRRAELFNPDKASYGLLHSPPYCALLATLSKFHRARLCQLHGISLVGSCR